MLTNTFFRRNRSCTHFTGQFGAPPPTVTEILSLLSPQSDVDGGLVVRHFSQILHVVITELSLYFPQSSPTYIILGAPFQQNNVPHTHIHRPIGILNEGYRVLVFSSTHTHFIYNENCRKRIYTNVNVSHEFRYTPDERWDLEDVRCGIGVRSPSGERPRTDPHSSR